MFYLLHLADSPIVPMDGQRYAEGMIRSVKAITNELEKVGAPAVVNTYIGLYFLSRVLSFFYTSLTVSYPGILKIYLYCM